jgi:hypothetical protein
MLLLLSRLCTCRSLFRVGHVWTYPKFSWRTVRPIPSRPGAFFALPSFNACQNSSMLTDSSILGFAIVCDSNPQTNMRYMLSSFTGILSNFLRQCSVKTRNIPADDFFRGTSKSYNLRIYVAPASSAFWEGGGWNALYPLTCLVRCFLKILPDGLHCIALLYFL